MNEKRARVSPLQSIVALTFATAVLWLLFSPTSPVNTGDAKPAPAADGAAPERAPAPRVDVRPRVASTSPAITDSLVALGLADHIVGRSPSSSASESMRRSTSGMRRSVQKARSAGSTPASGGCTNSTSGLASASR
ncbi:MAG: hypothetical protein ACKOYN_00600, partial [Planctomycetota bacterium]